MSQYPKPRRAIAPARSCKLADAFGRSRRVGEGIEALGKRPPCGTASLATVGTIVGAAFLLMNPESLAVLPKRDGRAAFLATLSRESGAAARAEAG